MVNGIPVGSPSMYYIFQRTTTLTLRYSGDDGLLPGSTSVVVHVRPTLGMSVSAKGLGRAPVTSMSRRQIPQLIVSMYPLGAGRHLRIVVQRKVGTKWVQVASISKTTSKFGVATYWAGPRKAGQVFRVRAIWAGDATLLPSTSPWRQFKVHK
jgi:hypothetical protein